MKVTRKATTLWENSSVMAQHNHFGVAQAKTVVDIMITKKKKKTTTATARKTAKKNYLYWVSQKFVPLLYKSVFQYDWTW